MTDAVRDLLDRLGRVDFQSDYATRKAHSGSRNRLMTEFLRRMALWVEHYQWTDSWFAFDIAEVVDARYRAPLDVESALSELAEQRTGSFGPVPRTLDGMVRLAAMRDDPAITLPELPDPYEPLLAFYQRGGGFVTEHGGVDTGSVTIPRKPPAVYIEKFKPLTDFSSAARDALDAEGQ